MRSPVIAFSLFAAAVVSPALVSGAPVSPIESTNNVSHPVARDAEHLPVTAVPVRRAQSSSSRHRKSDKSHEHKKTHGSSKSNSNNSISNAIVKRALDGDTAGGNAYSGGTSDSNGGTVVNEADEEDTEGDALTNDTASMYSVYRCYQRSLNVNTRFCRCSWRVSIRRC